VAAFGGDGDDDASTVAQHPTDFKVWAGGPLGGLVNFPDMPLDPVGAAAGHAIRLDPSGTFESVPLF
jgi:hypothetical protein